MAAIASYYAGRVTVVEVDAGATPVDSLSGTITDVRCKASSLVTAVIDYTAPTDKDLDELEMDQLSVIVGSPTDGSFSYFLCAVDGSYIADKFRLKYSLN